MTFKFVYTNMTIWERCPWKQHISKRGFPQPRVYQLMLVSIFLMFKCLTRGCQCERWGWWRSKNGPAKSSFIFLIHIYNIHRSRNLPSVQEEKEEGYLFWYFLNISVRIYQAWVVMFQKCPEKKKTPSLRPTQAPWPFAWKYSKYFWKKLHNFYNIRLSTCPRPSCFHSPSSMFSTKSWPSCQMKISHQAKIYN